MRLANGNLMTNRPVYADPTEASNRRRESRQRLSEAILGTGGASILQRRRERDERREARRRRLGYREDDSDPSSSESDEGAYCSVL
jgi:hypothetical protein